MYSGSDSTESQKYAQWALNPSTYQNVNNEEVDWAALAQQWIIMKEAGPPPIPGEQPILLKQQQQQAIKDIEEGGEAPMDVENDETSTSNWNTQQNMVPPTSGLSMESWNSWNSNQTPYWNNQWNDKPPLLPTPSGTAGNFSQFSLENNTEAPPIPFPPPTNEFPASGGGYWTTNKQIKPHNRRYSKVNVPRSIQPQTSPTVAPELPPVVPSTPPTLDANKRKQLPAWIREGLEKMERDKMKQMEKEREKQERDEYNQKLKQDEIEKMEILKTTIKEQQLLRSKFESDNEDSPPPVRNKRVSSPPPITLTSDELMLKVRRTMTQILLNVTTHHIETIAKEELERYKRKHKASDQRSSAPSGANISAKLGLGIYGDGSSSENEDTDDKGEEDNDSDAELKDTIRRKTLEFAKIEREIEAKLNEYKKIGNESRSSTPDTNDNDSQVDARFQGRKHSPENRTPPHRQQTESGRKKRSSSPITTDDEHYMQRKSRNKSSHYRRSTSTTSNFSNYSDNKKMRRNFSRSRTPPINKLEKSKHRNNKRERDSRRRRSYSRSRHRHRRSTSKRRYRRDSSSSSGSSSRRRSRSNSRRKTVTSKRRRSSSSHSGDGDGRRGKRSQHRH